MHINHSKFTSNTWDLIGRGMENQIHPDQLPLESLWPSYAVQTCQMCPSSSSSSQIHCTATTSAFFGSANPMGNQIEEEEEPEEELGAMKEMMYKIAAMQSVDIDPATLPKPTRRNVRISDDPQSVAARQRRERISEKIRILQRLVPGGTKMDTASMLDEAVRYVKFLKRQIRELQSNQPSPPIGISGCFAIDTATAPTTTTIAVTGDWSITSAKALGAPSSSTETAAGSGFAFGGSQGDPLGFNCKRSRSTRVSFFDQICVLESL